jgi:hypothetical protein
MLVGESKKWLLEWSKIRNEGWESYLSLLLPFSVDVDTVLGRWPYVKGRYIADVSEEHGRSEEEYKLTAYTHLVEYLFFRCSAWRTK